MSSKRAGRGGIPGPHAKGGQGRPRTSPKISATAARRLALITWLRLGYPSTATEERAELERLIEAERQRVLAAPVDTDQHERQLARLAELVSND